MGDREASGLYQAMAYLLPAKNFVVLDQDGPYRLLIAREPRQALAQLILRPAAYFGENPS